MENSNIYGDTGIGIVLFGLGRMGSIHANNCIQNRRCELRYIVDYEMQKALDFVELNRLKKTKVLHPENVTEALDDPLVHAALVSTLTHTHHEIVLKCLAKGKAVLCEKPLADSVEGIAKCYKEAEKRNCPLLCAFNRRFDPSHKQVRDEAVSGKLGNIRTVKTTSRDYPVPAVTYLSNSGGFFHDCCVHDIDMILWIVGEKPVTVSTIATAFIPEIAQLNDVDTAMVILKFPSGILGHIEIGRFASFGYDQRVEVLGEFGMLESKNQPKTSVMYSNDKGMAQDVLKWSFLRRYEESYKIELNHFFDVIEGKVDSAISGCDVILASQVVEACERSLKLGQVVQFN